MGIFKKSEEQVDPTKPLNEETGVTPAGEEAQAEPQAETQEETVPPEDKGIFNCTACQGTGLIGEPNSYGNKVCTSCQGTGKVN